MPSNRAVCAMIKQQVSPAAVGRINAAAVHFQLCVSFFMVSKAVAQGKCMRENSITQIAVTDVQPFCISTLPIAAVLPASIRLPADM